MSHDALVCLNLITHGWILPALLGSVLAWSVHRDLTRKGKRMLDRIYPYQDGDKTQ